MASCYSKVRDTMGLKADAQGSGNQYSWMYLLFSALDALESANPSADLLTGPSEVLRRLAPWQQTKAFAQIAEFIAVK